MKSRFTLSKLNELNAGWMNDWKYSEKIMKNVKFLNKQTNKQIDQLSCSLQ